MKLIDIHTKPGDATRVFGTTSFREKVFVANAVSREMAETLVNGFRDVPKTDGQAERPWKLGIPSTEGRYEVTVEDPFNGERTVSIAFCTRGGRLIGPSPSMKVVAWREVAEPYQDGEPCVSNLTWSGKHCRELNRQIPVIVKSYVGVETRFYVNGQDFYTDEKSIRAGDIRARVKEQGLPLNPDDKFIFVRVSSNPKRLGGRYVQPHETITMRPDMRIEIDNIPF